jgi:hypothetical protein
MPNSSFVAQEEVPELTYDLKPWGSSGTIPEPSRTKIKAFRSAFGDFIEAVAKSVGGVAPEEARTMPMSEQIKILSEFFSMDTSEMDDKMLHAMADLCSDHPSYDELEKSPYRVQQAFLGFLQGTFLSPKGMTSGMTP